MLRMCVKRNRGLLVIGILVLAVGIWLEQESDAAIPLYMFPGLLMILTWYLACQVPKNRLAIIIFGIAFSLVAFLFAIFVSAIGQLFEPAENRITDPSRYSEIRSHYGSSEAIQHFPETIPPNATNIEMVFDPGFLQAATFMQLKLTLPEEEIIEILSNFRPKAQFIRYGGESKDLTNLPEGIPLTLNNYFLKNSDGYIYPSTLEIIVLEAQPWGSSDFEWNHGYTYGLAYDSETFTIIYWVEDW